MERKISPYLKCLCRTLRLTEAEFARRLATAEKDCRIDRATYQRWLRNGNAPQHDSLQRLCKFLHSNYKISVYPQSFEDDLSSFESNLGQQLRGFQDIFSIVLGENINLYRAQDEAQSMFGGFYVLTRRHSREDGLCREVLYIGNHEPRGVDCRLITYKNAVYTGLAFRNVKLLYFVFARPHNLYRYASRFMIANTSVDGGGNAFHAIVLRITTSQGLPIASECIMERIKTISNEQKSDILKIMSDKRGKIPSKHWLLQEKLPLIGFIKSGSCLELASHERILGMTFVANDVPELERRLRETSVVQTSE